MNRIAVILLSACACVCVCACTDAPIKVDTRSIDWLTGCWRLERTNGYYEEVWLPPTADGTLGVSREVRGDKTASYEFLRIELRPGGVIAYVAKPSRQAEAEFLMTEHAPGKLAFANPEHDFPQRIEYRYVDLNAMTAVVQGPSKDGQTQSIEYPLQRVECKD